MPTTPILRIHPAIGLARVGNSPEYYLAPESIAALPRRDDPGGATTGGLPIDPKTDEIIESSRLRDSPGALKRQAARFRIFQYDESTAGQYPAPGASEVTIGSSVTVGGESRIVADILWTVHPANKKAASFESDDDHGVHAYEDGQTPVLRNLSEGLDPHNLQRLRRLVIDAGPRAICGTSDEEVEFRRASGVGPQATTTASYVAAGEIVEVEYPQSFPDMFFDDLDEHPDAIDTLGELRTDTDGRLIVAGGHGRSNGWRLAPPRTEPVPVPGPVNNDQWFDDTSDGPVSATLVFTDGTWTADVHGAWVVTTDPSYAPQTLNVVSLFDEAYDSFVRNLDLDPLVYRDGKFDEDFQPAFDDHIQPFFKAAAQQMWNTYLPEIAIDAHRAVGAIDACDRPDSTIMAGLAFIRRPETGNELSWIGQPSDVGAPLMPLALGDTSKSGGKSFLSPTVLQYFFLDRWAADSFVEAGGASLGDGEYLDRASLQNCLGGRFSPGIDIGFVIREPEMYEDWKNGAGPFRIKHEPLDYTKIDLRPTGPFLSLGWLPRHLDVMDRGLQPGDVSKFLALPWHADYNSCAIHQTSPNSLNSNSLYWSWPGQRPVTVYVAADYDSESGELPKQRYSVRGPGTLPADRPEPSGADEAEGDGVPEKDADMANAGRFWEYRQMLDDWHKLGTIVQGTVINDPAKDYPSDAYFEVESRLDDEEPGLADPHPWPLVGGKGTAATATS